MSSDIELKTSKPCANPSVMGSIVCLVLSSAVSVPFLVAGFCPSVNSLSLMPFMVLRSKGFVKWVNVVWLLLFSVTASSGIGVMIGTLMTYPGVLILQKQKYQEMGLAIETDFHIIPLILECLAGFLIGSSLMQLFLPEFLKDESYDIPESKLCAGMLQVVESAHLNEAPWLGQSLVAPIALVVLILAGNLSGIVPEGLSLPLFPRDVVSSRGLDIAQSLTASALTFPCAGGIMILGVGAIMPFRLVLIFVAGAVVKAIGSIIFLQIRAGGILENWQSAEYIEIQFPDGLAGNWTGAGSMGVCIVLSMIKVVINLRAAKRSNAEKSKCKEKLVDSQVSEEKSNASEGKDRFHVPKLYTRRQMIVVLAGFAIHASVLVKFGAKFSYIIGNLIVTLVSTMVTTYFAVLLSFTFGFSTAPTSGPLLIMGLLQCANLLVTVGLPTSESALELEFLEKYVPLMFLSLSMTSVAASVAANSASDLATMHLMKTSAAKGFTSQLLSGIPVVFLTPVVLILAEKTYGIGGQGIAAPQASMFASVFEGVLWGSPAWWPLCIGAVLGLSVVFLDEVLSRKCGFNFSPVAFSLGLYLPTSVAFGMFIASVTKLLGQYLHGRMMSGQADTSSWITQEFNICAAALLTGYSLCRLGVDVALCIAGISVETVELNVLTGLLGVSSIALIWICLVYNAYTGHLDPTVDTEAQGSKADGNHVEITESGNKKFPK